MDKISNDQLHDLISKGNHVRDLAEHPGFMLIMDVLKRNYDEAVEKLKVEKDIETIKELQNTIWKHDELAAQIYTYIEMGMDALKELSEQE